MSITNAITAASLINSRNNMADAARSRAAANQDWEYVRLHEQYSALVHKWNDLIDRHNQRYETTQASFQQTEMLMAFINAGRLALGQPSLTISDIFSAVELDPVVNKLREQIDKVGTASKIGFISRSQDYWENIKENVFSQFEAIFKNGYDETGLYGKIDRGAFLNGTYGQISGYQIFYNNKQSIRILADEKIQLKNKVYDLTDEVERLNEEIAQLRAQLAALQNT